MNVSQFIAEVQDVLDDPSAAKYPIASIVRHGDRQLRGLYRTMVEANKEYSNFTMCVDGASATQLMTNVWEYRLPTWVMACCRVYRRDSDPASTPTFSPYKWSPLGSVRQGMEIPKWVANDRLSHWSWEGNNTLRLWNQSTAQDLILRVAVRPPKMFKGRIATVSATTTILYLPAPIYGEVEPEEGAYINSDWQVTSTSNINATHFGDVRRCIYSTATALVSGARQHELTFDSAFTNALAADDTVETMVMLPDQHCRYLVLRTAQACLQKKNNIPGMRAIQPELAEEGSKFMTYAGGPRDARGPSVYKRTLHNRGPFDPDRINYWWY